MAVLLWLPTSQHNIIMQLASWQTLFSNTAAELEMAEAG